MRFDVRFNIQNQDIPLKFNHFIGMQTSSETEYYDGAYEVTPQRTDQEFKTANKMMTNNFVVKAIPKEYGLVTYDNNKIITIT